MGRLVSRSRTHRGGSRARKTPAPSAEAVQAAPGWRAVSVRYALQIKIRSRRGGTALPSYKFLLTALKRELDNLHITSSFLFLFVSIRGRAQTGRARVADAL